MLVWDYNNPSMSVSPEYSGHFNCTTNQVLFLNGDYKEISSLKKVPVNSADWKMNLYYI